MAVPSIHKVFIRIASEGEDRSSIRGSHIFMLVISINERELLILNAGRQCHTICIVDLLNELTGDINLQVDAPKSHIVMFTHHFKVV